MYRRITLNIPRLLPSPGADVINFDGQGVISYRFKMKKMKILKDVISLKFKTLESEGVILHGEGQQGDYITLELRAAKLVLLINLGKSSVCIQLLQGPLLVGGQLRNGASGTGCKPERW